MTINELLLNNKKLPIKGDIQLHIDKCVRLTLLVSHTERERCVTGAESVQMA